MNTLLEKYLPNVLFNQEEFVQAIFDTLTMVSISGAISLVLGTFVGILLVVTREGNILENKAVQKILSQTINVFRSIPFIILLAALLPLTRAIVGTGIGTKGAIVPLVFGTVPYLARQMDTALSEVSDGVIEAAQAMGSSPWEIIFRVYLREGLPGIIRGITITAVSLIGLSAMAGSIGGGGLGDFAIRYGYQRNHNDVTYVTVAVIHVMVTILQSIGSYFVKRTTH